MKTLRAKFIFWICLLFSLIGVFIFFSLSVILPQKLNDQILKRDIKIAQYLSREVQGALLVNNKLALKLLLEDRLESLGDIRYIFIRARDGAIVTSTFPKGLPKGLLHINEKIPEQQKSIEGIYNVEEFLVDSKKVYDIAISLLKGELGVLHVGVSLESSKAETAAFSKIKYYVAIVIFIGLGVGILIFALLGILLSNRVIRLKNFAVRIGGGDLDGSIDMKTDDEIGLLAFAFNEMALRLKEMVGRIKQLAMLEERNKIGLDLHDGCAQDLANMIKRLELCEKLFKIEPAKAFEELSALRENIRLHLNKARKIIHGLKAPRQEDFALLEEVKEYLKDYGRHNSSSIKLDIPEAVKNIPADKSRDIFYIITEALTNIKRHAQARNVALRLNCDVPNELTINIKDDGRGFDIKETELSASDCQKWGLMGMRQRADLLAGSLTINSSLDQGTEISVKIPLNVVTYNI